MRGERQREAGEGVRKGDFTRGTGPLLAEAILVRRQEGNKESKVKAFMSLGV